MPMIDSNRANIALQKVNPQPYIDIMTVFSSSGSVANSSKFRQLFAKFYQLNRAYGAPSFLDPYFEIFDGVKNGMIPQDIKTILEEIQKKCRKKGRTNGTIELSFASKMLHTINPDDYPIWDSILVPSNHQINKKRRHEHFHGAPYGIKNNGWHGLVDNAVKEYEDYMKVFIQYKNLATGNNNDLGGQDLIALFDNCPRFKGLPISNIKKIDFILWKDR